MTIEMIEPQTLQSTAQHASSGVALQQQRRGDIVGAGASLNDTARLIHVIAEAASNPAIDVDKMERLWAMHEKLKNRADEEAFNAAMSRAQSEMGRVSADAANQQTRSTYATYAALDKAIRPIYTKYGFSISFNEGEGAPEGHARILAYVSCGGHTRTYKLDMPNDGKGAKGGDVMTKTHATGSAHTYGRRYLLKDIFNIAIGENDNDGNGDEGDEDEGQGSSQHAAKSPADRQRTAMLDAGRNAAMQGTATLNKWWGALTAKDRSALQKEFGAMLRAARQADKETTHG